MYNNHEGKDYKSIMNKNAVMNLDSTLVLKFDSVIHLFIFVK